VNQAAALLSARPAMPARQKISGGLGGWVGGGRGGGGEERKKERFQIPHNVPVEFGFQMLFWGEFGVACEPQRHRQETGVRPDTSHATPKRIAGSHACIHADSN